jgi:hypothetical protein
MQVMSQLGVRYGRDIIYRGKPRLRYELDRA